MDERGQKEKEKATVDAAEQTAGKGAEMDSEAAEPDAVCAAKAAATTAAGVRESEESGESDGHIADFWRLLVPEWRGRLQMRQQIQQLR